MSNESFHVRFALSALMLGASLAMSGCGESGPAEVADQDELAAYVAENPNSGADLEQVEGAD